VRPEGAIVIDTTNNTIEETMLQLLKHVGGGR
jgi:cytidylate kinase